MKNTYNPMPYAWRQFAFFWYMVAVIVTCGIMIVAEAIGLQRFSDWFFNKLHKWEVLP